MTALPRLSPLAQSGVFATEYRGENLRFFARDGLRLLRVRSLAGPAGPAAAPRAWPQATGETSEGAVTVLCLRPGEWLCFGEPGSGIEALPEMLDPADSATYDLSDGLAVFQLEGPAAPWLLSKFSGLDFPAGIRLGAHCARTRLDDAIAIVHCDDNARIGLFVDRSLARHFWERLTESAPHAEHLVTESRAPRVRGAA